MKTNRLKIKPTKLKILFLLIVFQFAYIFLPAWGFISFLGTPKAYAANNNGMTVYQDGANNVPKYRDWDGSAFSAQLSDTVTTAATMQWLVVKEAPGRAEKIMGTLSSTGAIYMQVRNGGAWAIGTGAPVNGLYANVGTANDGMRGFDIAYERSSSDALIVYEDTTTADLAIYYRTWNGSSWSAEQTLTYTTGTSAPIQWVNLAPKEGSDEIMLVTKNDTADNTPDIRGIVWNGSSWVNEQLLTDAGSVAELNRNFDFEYEASSGDGLVVYGTGTTLDFWTYIGGTWTDGTGAGSTCTETGTGAACINPGAAVHNVELTSAKGTNYISIIGGDAGLDLWAQVWDGSGWLGNPSAIATWDEAATEFIVTNTMQGMDAAYEQAGNRIMFGFIDLGGTAIDYFFFDLDDNGWKSTDGTTSLTDIDTVTGTGNILADDGATLQMVANPNDTGQIMAVVNDLLLDIRAFLWNGSSWTTPTNSIQTGAHGGTAQLYQPFYFVWDSTTTTVTVGAAGTQASLLAIPSTNNHVGGAFTVIQNTAVSKTISSIIITEQGTVNANTNLSSVVLFYKQEATCSSSIPVDATQWNTTGASFNASEKATVTGDSAMAVTTSQICVYVRLNVGSGTTDLQTMEIEISNPSTEVTTTAESVTPGTAVAISGQTSLEIIGITVGTTGTQASPLAIPSADNNVGGAFTFVRNQGSANVTQIIVTDTGTVNANTNITDVVLFYKQEVSCSASIPGDATQFNSTPATFNVSEKATATGTISVGTSQICVYVRIDVGSGTSDGQTFEIEISNPSTEVTASAGVVKPSTAVARSGTTTLNLPTFSSYGVPFLYTQANWGTGGAGLTFYYEVYMKAVTGNAFTRLYNETTSTAVANSQMSTTSTSYSRLRTASALTLTDGQVYRAQFGKVGSEAGETKGAKLITPTSGGGADLAEYFQSPEALDLGEVVAVDPNQVASVVRSGKPYQADTIGIVSTKPGLILGMNIGQSYPIALAGRVPVKFSSENGLVKSGDRLTSASIPGYAMKATKAGRAIGTALESFDPAKATACPSTSRATNAKPACGSVEVFVNLSDYQGQSLGAVIADQSSPGFVAVEDFGATSGSSGPTVLSLPGTELDDASRRAAERYNQQLSRSQNLLGYFRQIDDAQPAFDSDIFTGELAASERIITPQVVTDELIAKRIRADQIEGLSLIIESVAARAKTPAAMTPEVNSPDKQATVSVGLNTLGSLDFSRSSAIFSDVQSVGLTVLARLESQGGLLVSGDSEFKGQVLFRLLSTFEGPTDFKQPQLLSSDSGGIVTIKKDELEVEVKFKQDYPLKPLITASYYFEGKDGKDDLAAQQAYNKAGYRFVVTKISQTGFTIVLNQPATADMRFSWLAVAVKEETTTGQL